MNWTAIDRRRLLAGFGGVLAVTALPRNVRGGGSLFLSAYATAGSGAVTFGVAALDAAGAVAFATPLPGRAHAVVPHPVRGEAVVFGRRPGRWFVPVDLADGEAAAPVAAPEDRRFAGHGAFSPDGRLLYAVEDDVPRETGAIGVYDAADGYRRLGAIPTHGVGPHDLVLLDGGRAAAVANGGVLTHPDTGRVKLNLEEMESSLTVVDTADGRLLSEARLPEEHANLGIRHLAGRPDGSVVFGVQDERPTGAIQPLVGLHSPGGDLRLFEAPEEEWLRFEGYIGSVASDGPTVAGSSPRGGRIGVWDADSGRWLGSAPLPDGCGLAVAGAGGGYLATSGHGAVAPISPHAPDRVSGHGAAGFRWDNHLTRLG
ncbi:DUF1513 domain-containing protein [Azospirillum halopraeferens]|uniref:DUF1513 domain-containing protein n=1 Tax=Azospirillum halopraeferens TaxID=34010 RepID=UPI00040A7470|nr:DUF1513 domain-containing protein [Azospirillum halopraeferens]